MFSFQPSSPGILSPSIQPFFRRHASSLIIVVSGLALPRYQLIDLRTMV